MKLLKLNPRTGGVSEAVLRSFSFLCVKKFIFNGNVWYTFVRVTTNRMGRLSGGFKAISRKFNAGFLQILFFQFFSWGFQICGSGEDIKLGKPKLNWQKGLRNFMNTMKIKND